MNSEIEVGTILGRVIVALTSIDKVRTEMIDINREVTIEIMTCTSQGTDLTTETTKTLRQTKAIMIRSTIEVEIQISIIASIEPQKK